MRTPLPIKAGNEALGLRMRLVDKTALIIIDQQQGLNHPKLGARNNPNAEIIMLQLLHEWRAMQWPIFHIKHRSVEPDSVFWPLQSGFEFKVEFVPRDRERVVEKSIPCAFLKTGLGKILEHQTINAIVLVGAATNNSIEATARTAGNLGLRVLVVEDACFTFAKADYFGTERTATKVHAMSLANIHGEYAQVVNSRNLLTSISQNPRG